MAERIYYACKYTTKDQHNVECKIALALAGFQNRNQHVQEAEASGTPLSDDVICHRRLTSHLFHMTNKHETAGPLVCALFILQQSCAYFSHVYKSLPLCQMLNQLMQNQQTIFQFQPTSMPATTAHLENTFSLGDDSRKRSSDDESITECDYDDNDHNSHHSHTDDESITDCNSVGMLDDDNNDDDSPHQSHHAVGSNPQGEDSDSTRTGINVGDELSLLPPFQSPLQDTTIEKSIIGEQIHNNPVYTMDVGF